jgi:hypothetical protein
MKKTVSVKTVAVTPKEIHRIWLSKLLSFGICSPNSVAAELFVCRVVCPYSGVVVVKVIGFVVVVLVVVLVVIAFAAFLDMR